MTLNQIVDVLYSLGNLTVLILLAYVIYKVGNLVDIVGTKVRGEKSGEQ